MILTFWPNYLINLELCQKCPAFKFKYRIALTLSSYSYFNNETWKCIAKWTLALVVSQCPSLLLEIVQKGKNSCPRLSWQKSIKLASFADRVKLTDYQLFLPRNCDSFTNNFKHKLPPTFKKVHNYQTSCLLRLPRPRVAAFEDVVTDCW